MIPVYIGVPCNNGLCGGWGPPSYWWQPDPGLWARPVIYGGCNIPYYGSGCGWGGGGWGW